MKSIPRKKKSLGQHFLRDNYVVKDVIKVVKKLNPNNQPVIEIGPGDGALTGALLESGYSVCAIELDTRWIEHLQTIFSKFVQSGQLVIYHADASKVKPKDIGITGAYHVVGNIPYYITGLLLRSWLSKKDQPQSLTFIMQREVAQRIVCNDKKTSILSCSVKVYGSPKLERVIKPGAFSPPPKVDSALLSISDISREHFKKAKISEDLFFKVIKQAYGQKRKQAISNLKTFFEKQQIGIALKTLGLRGDIRAEDISVDVWVNLVKLLQ